MTTQVFNDAEEARLQRNDHVLALDQFSPWREHVRTFDADAYYVVYPAAEGGWLVRCLPPSSKSLAQRVPMPEAWAGLGCAELQEVSGVSDATFCHPGRFIAGAKSRDGALELAAAALAQQFWDERVEAVRALRAGFERSLKEQAG